MISNESEDENPTEKNTPTAIERRITASLQEEGDWVEGRELKHEIGRTSDERTHTRPADAEALEPHSRHLRWQRAAVSAAKLSAMTLLLSPAL